MLRLITGDDIADVLAGDRRFDWAEDFPSSGDLVIARLLSQIGAPSGPSAPFGHRLIIERASGLVVGGAGFFGPPEGGQVEIGYGVVVSRQGAGYATEAVIGMIELARQLSGVERITATVEPDNRASVRVLEKVGMSLIARSDSTLTFELVTTR